MKPTAVLSVVLLWAPSLLGCGTDAPAGEPQQAAAGAGVGTRIEACELLTRSEVEDALGRSVSEPLRTTQDGFDASGTSLVTVCNWDAGGLMDGVAVTVRQFAVGGASRSSAEYAREAEADLARQKADPEQAPYVSDIRFTPLDVPPHAAVVMDWGDYVAVQLYRNGSRGVQLVVSGPRASVAETLVRTAAARLPAGSP